MDRYELMQSKQRPEISETIPQIAGSEVRSCGKHRPDLRLRVA